MDQTCLTMIHYSSHEPKPHPRCAPVTLCGVPDPSLSSTHHIHLASTPRRRTPDPFWISTSRLRLIHCLTPRHGVPNPLLDWYSPPPPGASTKSPIPSGIGLLLNLLWTESPKQRSWRSITKLPGNEYRSWNSRTSRRLPVTDNSCNPLLRILCFLQSITLDSLRRHGKVLDSSLGGGTSNASPYCKSHSRICSMTVRVVRQWKSHSRTFSQYTILNEIQSLYSRPITLVHKSARFKSESSQVTRTRPSYCLLYHLRW